MNVGVHESVTSVPEDDPTMRTLVVRLSRTSRSGEAVIERAAILAEGAESHAIIRWILAHGGQPEANAAPVPSRGLHGARSSAELGSTMGAPRRYVLPAGTLTAMER
jgi:hypothetical protein